MVKRMKEFTVGGKFTMWVELAIEAENLEDALAKARELRETDFVEPKGHYIDGEYLGVVNVYDNNL